MKNDTRFHVFSCDASAEQVSLSWAVCDEARRVMEHAELEYLCSRARGRSERFVPSVEYVRTVVGAHYDDLRCICCTVGPGSFTGLRNTLAFVKGLIAARAQASPIRAVAVRTHDAIAYRYRVDVDSASPLLVVNDARSGRYYAALYHALEHTNGDHELDPSVGSVAPPIYDYSVDEVLDLLGGNKRLFCVGNAAENFACVAKERKPALCLEVLRSAPCTMVQAVMALGLQYYDAGKYEISEFSQPLYVRAAL